MNKAVLKTITYRIGAVMLTVLTSYILGVPIEVSSAIGVLTEVVHTVFYYIHERLWEER